MQHCRYFGFIAIVIDVVEFEFQLETRAGIIVKIWIRGRECWEYPFDI